MSAASVAAVPATGPARWLPILEWLPRYERRLIRWDAKSLDRLVRLAEHVRDEGAELWLAAVRAGPCEELRRAGIDPVSGSLRWFRTGPEAIAAFESRRGTG